MISQRPEDVFIYLIRSAYHNARHAGPRLAARRPTLPSKLGPPARHLNTSSHSLSYSRTCLRPSIGRGTFCRSSNTALRARIQPYATDSTNSAENTKPREIAVLGAGITGLTAAHYLARYAKNAHITIYEASGRPGGWIKADRVLVEDDNGQLGHVMFQSGPRMLRSSRSSIKYDDLVLFDMLPSPEPSIANLVGMIQSYLTEPIWSGGLAAAWNYCVSYNKTLNPLFDPNQIPEDESVAQFLKRILGDDRIGQNIVSGMMHGIYGGDINKLSVKHTILADLWNHFKYPIPGNERKWIDRKEKYLLADMLSSPNRLKIIELAEAAIHWKLLAFEDGLVSLVNGLVKDLNAKPNVTFRYNEPITSLEHEDGKILVTTPKAKAPAKYDHVISTLFSKQLAQITQPPNSLPSLAETHAVTIMVVNLWYPNPNLLADGGFGYLIPSSTPNNDEGVLGVLFDSDLRTDDNEIPGTKLTVMLGGHHWDGWEHLPSEELGIALVKDVVRRQLGISDTEKVFARARLCRDCLPQHFVGHRDRMKQARYDLISTFQGHLTVAGPSYTSVGVVPAMRAGYDAGMRVAREGAQPWFRISSEDAQAENESSPPDFDHWRRELEEDAGGIADVVGACGLEWFTESEWDQLDPTERGRLLFRTFTDDALRFQDEDGEYVDVDRREFQNAPPGFKAERNDE
ncbi:hypothetical protein O1611_g1568 [Lasiodiplodia mahajangana]|uniref:Uncharacterized protein n=1 Tax=Lasiodiplodia mahajangana TaxID=1108764 RepID=A0ACC2JX76_9PEZI|nr:hypothetical protein O1611_g1568 [Lasiodiplodia mahajangana]